MPSLRLVASALDGDGGVAAAPVEGYSPVDVHLSDPQLLLLVGRGQDRLAGKRMHLGHEGRLAHSVAGIGRNERQSALAQRSVHRRGVENRRRIHARGSCRWCEIDVNRAKNLQILLTSTSQNLNVFSL